MWLFSITSLVLAVLLLVYHWRRRHIYVFARQLAGPPTLPLLGNALMFIGPPDRVFHSLHKIYHQLRNKGITIGRIWLGPKLLVAIADPVQISLVLNHNLKKAKEYELFDEILHKGIFVNSNISQWKISRKMITPVFHFNVLKSYIHIFHSEASILAEKWAPLAKSGASFNPEEAINLATFDMVMLSTLGINPQAQDLPDHPFLYHIDRAFEIAITRIFNPLLHSNWICHLIGIRKRQKTHVKVLIDLAQQTLNQIRDGQANMTKRKYDDDEHKDKVPHLTSCLDSTPLAPSFAELMMQHPSYDPSDDEELISEIVTIIGAGQDTTKTVNMVVLLMLAIHQDVQEKVLEEIDRVLGKSSSSPSYEDLGRLEYLEWVIKETLRLYPAAPIIGRYIYEDFPLGDGIILPAGVTALISIYALHRDSAFFSRPHCFDPDRWAPDLVKLRPPGCFIPFSTGPRNCIGARYAMLQMKTTLSTLLRKYRMLPGQDCERMEDVKFTMRVTIKMEEGCKIRLQGRGQ